MVYGRIYLQSLKMAAPILHSLNQPSISKQEKDELLSQLVKKQEESDKISIRFGSFPIDP